MAATANVKTLSVVIPAYDAGPPEVLSISPEVDIEGYMLAGIHMPAAWDAANLTFQAAPVTGGTFQNIYDDAGIELTMIAAVSRSIALDLLAGVLAPWRFLKIRSGTSGIPVNQASARIVTLALKG